MLQVQKIAVINHAGFVLWCEVVDNRGRVWAKSGKFPINQEDTLDLGNTGCPPGTTIHPVVHAELGKTESGDSVEYQNNGNTATYEVRGVTQAFKVQLLT